MAEGGETGCRARVVRARAPRARCCSLQAGGNRNRYGAGVAVKRFVLDDTEALPLPENVAFKDGVPFGEDGKPMSGGEVWRRAAAAGHPKLDPVPLKVVL